MNAAQQHLLDTYRAARRGEAAPPAPDTHTARTAREIQQWRRFQAVVTAPGSRLRGRVRRGGLPGLTAWLRRLTPRPGPRTPRTP
ncbi:MULTISPECIES: hypothetical protein [unclassified Streptomyces]|uniref:hypothetical protein n=1 Tax=unclassified Streptomyces TaxID=2593676 RepID=UPI00115FCDB7|nr:MULTISPECIES: hypothetical protein [unclassified Streptomyces]